MKTRVTGGNLFTSLLTQSRGFSVFMCIKKKNKSMVQKYIRVTLESHFHIGCLTTSSQNLQTSLAKRTWSTNGNQQAFGTRKFFFSCKTKSWVFLVIIKHKRPHSLLTRVPLRAQSHLSSRRRRGPSSGPTPSKSTLPRRWKLMDTLRWVWLLSFL